MERPKVSVIIPTYNSGKTLEKCLESVENQTYPSYEIIVIDSFSSDGTLRIAEKFKTKIIQQKSNPALARNIGMTSSTGKYVLFLDSDQVLSSSVIEESVERCENEKAGMARISEVFIGEGFWGSCSATWKNYYQKVERLYKNNVSLFSGEPRFFAKGCLTSVGMFDTSLIWGEDYDLYERLKKAEVKETMCKSKIYHYELESIKDILIKNLRYGESMPTFMQQTNEQLFPRMLKHAFLTFREILSDFKGVPTLIVGCGILLYLKTCSIVLGLTIGLASVRGKN